MSFIDEDEVTVQINKPISGYEPLDEDNPPSFQLTYEQHNIIDQFAQLHDIKYNAALNIIWHDCFDLLNQALRIQERYKQLVQKAEKTSIYA